MTVLMMSLFQFQKVRALLLQNLQVEGSNHAAVHLLEQQGTPEWFNQRRVRVTAYLCKVIVCFKSE